MLVSNKSQRESNKTNSQDRSKAINETREAIDNLATRNNDQIGITENQTRQKFEEIAFALAN